MALRPTLADGLPLSRNPVAEKVLPQHRASGGPLESPKRLTVSRLPASPLTVEHERDAVKSRFIKAEAELKRAAATLKAASAQKNQAAGESVELAATADVSARIAAIARQSADDARRSQNVVRFHRYTMLATRLAVMHR